MERVESSKSRLADEDEVRQQGCNVSVGRGSWGPSSVSVPAVNEMRDGDSSSVRARGSNKSSSRVPCRLVD